MHSVLLTFYTMLLNLRELQHSDNHNESRQFEICALLGYYAPYSGDSLQTFRNNLAVPSSEVWTERLSRYVGKELPPYAALYIAQKNADLIYFAPEVWNNAVSLF